MKGRKISSKGFHITQLLPLASRTPTFSSFLKKCAMFITGAKFTEKQLRMLRRISHVSNEPVGRVEQVDRAGTVGEQRTLHSKRL
jgi:hypothetical protein